MEFTEVLEQRRSVRQFESDPVPDEVMQKAFSEAVLAPNSSNLQTWDFYWIRSKEAKAKLVSACLDQAAARTAKELVVVVADFRRWRRAQSPLLKWAKTTNAPKAVIDYYEKLIPIVYATGPFNVLAPLKWVIFNLIGLFRPIMRGPAGQRGLKEVAIKSAALASENFVLSLKNQGFDSCMMEGFDEVRVKGICQTARSARVVMVIAVGKSKSNGIWGERFRIDLNEVVHEV